MLKEVVEKIVQDYLKEKMPQTLQPPVMFARVTRGGTNKVNLRILKSDNQVDSSIQEIPDVETDVTYETGEKVIISFLNGELEQPVILRKWQR